MKRSLKNCMLFVLTFMLILWCNQASSGAVISPEFLLCPDNIDFFSVLPGNGNPGKNVGFITVSNNDSFLLGESGDTVYHISDQGNAVYAFALDLPDHEKSGVHIKAGFEAEDRFVFVAYDYQSDNSIIAITGINGKLLYSQTIPAAIRDAKQLDDGLLLCGSKNVQDAVSGQMYLLPWAAKINETGEIVWEYTETAIKKDVKQWYRVMKLCAGSGNADEYVFIVMEHNECIRWSALHIDSKGDYVSDNTIPIEQYQLDASVDIRDAWLEDDKQILLINSYNDQGETSYLLTIRNQEILWTYSPPIDQLILTAIPIREGYACISTKNTETFSKVSILFLDDKGKLVSELPYSHTDLTQDVRIDIGLSRLIFSHNMDLWGIGISASGSLDGIHSYIYITRFIAP